MEEWKGEAVVGFFKKLKQLTILSLKDILIYDPYILYMVTLFSGKGKGEMILLL